jgi:phosphate starvation-inducible PhoH-like protein
VISCPDPTQTLRAQTLELPARLLPALQVTSQRIEAAMRPYRLRLTPQSGGLLAEGDDLAVTLVARIVEDLGKGDPAPGQTDEAQILTTAAATTRDALKHDLSWRLTGLHQPLRPMSLAQVAFVNALLHGEQSLVFGVGATGTGKTHLALASALSLLAQERVKHVVITRPHVLTEGEVMTPALRAETEPDGQLAAIEDVLRDLVGTDEIKRLVSHGLIEITPLGRMRGRTFNDSFIIVDEAQNMSIRKMRMAVTRLGRGSRMVITGDPDQIDLPGDEPSGLPHLLDLVAGTDIALVHQFTQRQIVRNEVVARLEALYRKGEEPDLKAAA